jgi:hypothetical protein
MCRPILLDEPSANQLDLHVDDRGTGEPCK